MDHNQLHPSPNDQHETTDKASCCCDVHIGSLSDPTTAQGLAHFLEHMLFMGTEAYPDENAYQAFLASHNGYSNAYTDLESTVYYFDVQSDHLEHALDMFASFFTTPLFNESSVDREINAVDSENAKNLQSDMWRSYQLMKSLAKTNHPYSKFSTGNLKTLKESVELQQLNIRELLLDFYQTYYSANLMKVCVYGKEDLQTLESWVVNKFSSIPNKQLTCPIFDSNPYGENELKTFVQMVPIRDKIELNIEFPLFSMNKFYLSKPDDYITSLLGHESEGSILHALKTVGYANSLSSYVNSNCKDFAFVCIDIELSELGSNYVNEVIECVFAYIHMLNKEGCQLWYAQELKDIHDLKYKFLEKSQPSDYVTKLANNMQIYEPKDTLVSTYTIQSIDLSTVPEIINKLIPENCIILYKNKKLITNKIESWYGTNYSDHKFSSEQMQLWNAALQGLSHWEVYMPKPNPFIPNEFAIRCESLSFETIDNMKNIQLIAKSDIGIMLDESIYCDENEVSIASVDMKDKEAIKESDVVDEDEEEEDKEDEEVEQEDKNVSGANGLMKLFHGKIGHTWFKMDLEWKVPKLNVIILLESNISSSSPYGVAMTDLFGHVLKEKLSSFSYYADVSGLHYDIRLAKGGLELMFFGYHNKLSVLVLKAIEELKSCLLIDNITNELFHRMKEKVLRSYYNSLFWQPYYHAIHGTSYCLEDPRWSNAEKQNAIFDISLIDFISFIRQFIRYLKIEILIHGNATINEAKVFSNDIINCLETLPLSSNQEPIRRVIHLDIAKEYIYRQHAKHFNINEMNSAIENLYFIGLMTLKSYNQQVDMKGLKNEAYLNLLVQLLSDKAFDQLRTKEQLGYIVFTGIKGIGQYQGLQLIIQSNHKDPIYLNQRIELFLLTSLDEIRNKLISDEILLSFINATIEKLLEKPKNIDEETTNLLEEIHTNTYFFERKIELAKYLQQLVLPISPIDKMNVSNGIPIGDYGIDLIRSELIQFMECFIVNRLTRRKLSSQFYGCQQGYPKDASKHMIEQENVVIIDDPSSFKRLSTLLPSISYDYMYSVQ